MAPRKNNPAGNTADREIVITRVFDAPRELVWEAWTDPQQMVRWWGPNGFTTTIQELDVRPGGVSRHVMHGPDGTDYPNRSVFTEVVKPERIVYQHGGRRKGGPAAQFEATWTFEALPGNRTRLTMRSVFPSAAARDRVVKEYGAIEGGKQTLGRLAAHLAARNAGAPSTLPKLVVTRLFEAPAERVFDAWLDPRAVRRWMFATPDGEMQRVEIDPRVGGAFAVVEKRGRELAEHLGTYEAIERPHRLVFTFAYQKLGPTRVTVEIAAVAGGCRLTLTQELNPPWAQLRDRAHEGWTMMLEGLATALGENRDFVILRVFEAPRDLVWRAWTDPQHVTQWWGPRGFANPVCEMDVRPGGAFRIVMRGADGTDYPLTGVYREIAEPERLVMTLDCSEHPDAWHDAINPRRRKGENAAGHMLQTATFEDLGGKTRLTIRTRFESSAIREAMLKMGMTEGWSQSLDRLAAVVAKSRPPAKKSR